MMAHQLMLVTLSTLVTIITIKYYRKSTNDITFKRKDEPEYFTASDSSGLFAALSNGATVTRYWEFMI
jgi:hypothetical protein